MARRAGVQRTAREILGVGGWGCQVFRFPVFQEEDIRAKGRERVDSAEETLTFKFTCILERSGKMSGATIC